MWKWFETFIDEMKTGIVRLWHPKLFWDGKYSAYPKRRVRLDGTTIHELTHWHAFWYEMADKQLDKTVVPFLFTSGIIPMLALFPLPYAVDPIAGHSHAKLVDGKRGPKFMEMPPWMVTFIRGCPNYILNVYNQSDSIIVTWMRTGLEDFLQKSMPSIPKNWRCAAGYSLIDYAALNACNQCVVDILFQAGHLPTHRVWTGILEIVLIRGHFIGPWVYWMSLMAHQQKLPRMPPQLMTHYASKWEGNTLTRVRCHSHRQLNTLYEIAMEEEKRISSISLEHMSLNE